ncbi:MAG TPA: lysozyme inhibitor LprI family protein, partial [Syntrophales bacterium]|nr:lysozyme inhibitor LprI family protein [Syntrophales bacterium]
MPNQTRLLCWEKLFIIVVIFGLLSTQALAASFDCNKATTWLEKTVCSNPELSKLDEELAKAYHDALASLSPEGQKETKQYQRQWLKEISSYSKAKLKLGFDDNDAASNLELLQRAYEERIEQLQQQSSIDEESLIKFPDRTFRNVYVNHSRTDKTCPSERINIELTYPQILNPRDENEKSWNNLVSKIASCGLINPTSETKCVNIDVKITVSFSNRHLISVQNEQWWGGQGA